MFTTALRKNQRWLSRIGVHNVQIEINSKRVSTYVLYSHKTRLILSDVRSQTTDQQGILTQLFVRSGIFAVKS